MNIDLDPKRDVIIARIVEIDRSTKMGLVLPQGSDIKGESAFAYVEKCGPDVKSCKPGDLILPLQVGHIWLRGGTFHRVAIVDKDVVATVTGIEKGEFRYVDEHDTEGPSRVQPNDVPPLLVPTPRIITTGHS